MHSKWMAVEFSPRALPEIRHLGHHGLISLPPTQENVGAHTTVPPGFFSETALSGEESNDSFSQINRVYRINMHYSWQLLQYGVNVKEWTKFYSCPCLKPIAYLLSHMQLLLLN